MDTNAPCDTLRNGETLETPTSASRKSQHIHVTECHAATVGQEEGGAPGEHSLC